MARKVNYDLVCSFLTEAEVGMGARYFYCVGGDIDGKRFYAQFPGPGLTSSGPLLEFVRRFPSTHVGREFVAHGYTPER